MSSKIESTLRIERYNKRHLKLTLFISNSLGITLFNESIPLIVNEQSLTLINNTLPWDLTTLECNLFFSTSIKGVYNYTKTHESLNDVIAKIINEQYLMFLPFKDKNIVFKETANYEEYFDYE